jgi:hypothetical protein
MISLKSGTQNSNKSYDDYIQEEETESEIRESSSLLGAST